jgi:peroxiredoxin
LSEAPDLHALPPGLPEPIDDGAADHLTGLVVPAVRLRATGGGDVDLAAAAAGALVLFVYPRTGTPGQPVPDGWDEMPGARGCTPQSCAFRDLHADLAANGATVHGLSAQPAHEQDVFADRERLPYALLNDEARVLARPPLALPTFDFPPWRLYRRLTLIARRGRIEKVFYPVFPPDRNATEVLAWLRASA